MLDTIWSGPLGLQRIVHSIFLNSGDSIGLPFDNVLHWEKAAIILAKAHASELQFILKSYSDTDIVALKRQGRRFLETYLGSPQMFLETLLSSVRVKISMPAPPVQSQKSDLVGDLKFGSVIQQVGSVRNILLRCNLVLIVMQC